MSDWDWHLCTCHLVRSGRLGGILSVEVLLSGVCLSGRQKEWEPQWPVYMSLCGGGCAPSRCCVTVLAEIETPHPARGAPLAGSHRSQCHNLTCLRPEAGQQTVLGTGCCTTIEALGWVSFYLPLGWNHIPCPVFAAKSLRQYNNSRISRLSWQTVFL